MKVKSSDDRCSLGSSPGTAVLHQPSVGGFGLKGHSRLEAALFRARVAMHATSPALSWFRPSPQLEPAELLGGEGGTGVGVVLLPTKEMPAEHDELAGDGDRGDVWSSAGPDALPEGPKRT